MIEDGEVTTAVALESMRDHGPDAPQVLKDAVAKAQSKGGSGITRKHLPMQIYRKVITKSAPAMVQTFEKIKGHDAFESLPDEIKTEIIDILDAIAKAKQD
jgi:hypothetical protein